MPRQKPETEKPAEDTSVDIAALTIEQCFEELEQIVETLEDDNTPLEDSLQLFERGMKIKQRCEKELSQIERRIKLIVETSSGEIEAVDFEGSPDNGERTTRV